MLETSIVTSDEVKFITIILSLPATFSHKYLALT